MDGLGEGGVLVEERVAGEEEVGQDGLQDEADGAGGVLADVDGDDVRRFCDLLARAQVM